MSLTQLFSPPLLNLPDLHQRTQILLLVRAAELLTFLGFATQDFYGGSHTIGLLVHAYLPTPAGTPHLSRFIESSVGTYSTGSTGQLLYRASSLWDYLLFFSIADFTFLDALFIFFAFLYLHLAVARLKLGHEFSVGISQAFFRIGLGSTCMFIAKMQFNLYVATVFDEKTQHQFALVNRSSGMLYALLGSLLLLCTPFLQLGQQLQQDAELTI